MIRDAEKRDAEVVYALMAELEGKEPNRGSFTETFLENLRTRHYPAFERDGLILGFCGLSISSPPHHERPVAEIE